MFLRAAGCTVDTKAGKGSHVIVRRPGCSPYTVPDRKDLDDVYIRQCCRQFGLDHTQLIGRAKKKPVKKK